MIARKYNGIGITIVRKDSQGYSCEYLLDREETRERINLDSLVVKAYYEVDMEAFGIIANACGSLNSGKKIDLESVLE